MTQAAAATLRARYSLTYVGFRVGELAIANTVERSVYDTTLDARLTGLATVASSYRHVSMKAHGILRGTTAVPTSFSVTQTGQDESRKLQISLAGGSATSIEIDPPIEDADQRVPIIDEHKRNVVDPRARSS